jgi:NADH:ubiquinone oxidoreductase subunit D
LDVVHTQGLLWRSTEQLLEYRTAQLSSGYFARLDYVAYIAQEVAYSGDVTRYSNVTLPLFLLNCTANHALNTACTIADAGALGAILWAFELRELIEEQAEASLGARLHSNLGLPSAGHVNSGLNTQCSAVLALLIDSTINVRVSASRLLGNFLITSEHVFSSGSTGWMMQSTGLTDDASTQQLSGDYLAILGADSLSRYLGRVSQALTWACIATSTSTF